MLFKDRVCLAVDGPDIDRVQAVARDFRSCTTSVKVGPALLIAEGPYAVRALSELGMTDIIIDARLFGHPREIWTGVTEAAKITGVRAITVQGVLGQRVLKIAVDAAKASVVHTHRVERPYILAVSLPALANTSAERRDIYIKQFTEVCCSADVDGLIVDYEDIACVRAVCARIPVLADAQRGPVDYRHGLTPRERKLPGAKQVLTAGAEHVFFDMALLQTFQDIEWTAELLTKELGDAESAEAKKRGRMRNLLDQAGLDLE